MPKIKQVRFSYHTKTEWKHFYLTIKVGADFKFYFDLAELPKEITDLLGQQHEFHFTADQFNDLRLVVEERIKSFEKMIADEGKRKVIVYTVSLNGEVQAANGRTVRMHDLDSVGHGVPGMAVRYRVGWEHRIGGQKTYADDFGNQMAVYDSDKVIDWTPERERWFQQVTTNLEQLILKVHRFFNVQKPNALLKVIDNGQLLIGSPKTKKE